MSGEHTLSVEQILQVHDQVRLALESSQTRGLDQDTIAALQSTLALMNRLVDPEKRTRKPKYRGCIEYTFEDTNCPPYGRQIDTRIYYDWDDYNPIDEPFPMWGARVEEIDLLAVRYFDRDGNVVEIATHHQDLAWMLLAKEREAVTQACTDDGCFSGVGKAHPLYIPSRRPAQTPCARRMAPSQRSRENQQQQQQRKSI